MPRLPGVLTFALPILIGAVPIQSQARVWNIRADGSGDAPTIQAAIDQAAAGDTILVGPGDYPVHLWIETTPITIRSTDGPARTVLHGSPVRDDPVVDFFFDGGGSSTIEGFTIREGRTGIQCTSASPTIRGNVIEGNQSALGAGICCTFSSDAVIEGNLIAGNRTWFHCCFPSRGGGVYADENSAAIIRDNVIAWNRCDGECLGGGVSAFIASIEGNTIVGNRADGPGGGVELPYDGATLANNIIMGNISGEFGDGIVAFRTATLFCNDVYSNGDEDYSGIDPGPGDFSLDPRFCRLPGSGSDPGGVRIDDFDLRSDSPCLPGQDPNGADCGTIGARPQGCAAPSPAHGPATLGPSRALRIFPNPARVGATIGFAPSRVQGEAVVEIVDAGGRIVARIEPDGPGIARWDGRDEQGRPAAAGVYYAKVRSGSLLQEGTILLIR